MDSERVQQRRGRAETREPASRGSSTDDAIESLATGRREFLGRMGIGAVAVAAALAPGVPAVARAEGGATEISPAGSAGRSLIGPWSDAWLDRITGKHKQFFDAVTPNEGFAMAFAMGFLNLNHEAYGLSDKDLTAIVGLRHFAMPIALGDELWERYQIGSALKVNDPKTNAPATRNPFLHSDGAVAPGADVPTLVGRGVIFTVCNVALTVLSGRMAKAAGVSPDVAKREWTEKLVPGTTLVPVGVLAVNRAQERGCTYCYGG